MLRSSLCLLFSAMFASAVFAQPGRTDIQSLQYEFGRSATPVFAPACRCAPVHWGVPVRCCVPVRPVVCAPVVVCPVVCAPIVVRPAVCAPVVRPIFAPRWHRWHHPMYVHPGFVW